MNIPVAGDIYLERSIWIQVEKVDPGGQWAIIHCYQTRVDWRKQKYLHEWVKQQPLGIPGATRPGCFPDSWVKTENALCPVSLTFTRCRQRIEMGVVPGE